MTSTVITTPVDALRKLWISCIPEECEIPSNQVFGVWLHTAPFEECTKAIRKSGRKMSRVLQAGGQLLGRTSAARYVSAILGEYRRRGPAAREQESNHESNLQNRGNREVGAR